MNAREVDLLERWQAATTGRAEKRLIELTDAADDLTTLAQTREGAHMIRGNMHQLKDVLRKIYDLYVDFQGVAK